MRVAVNPWVVGSLSAIFLLACGGPEPILSVESPSIVTVAPGGSTTLTVNLTRNETAKGTFSFAATGLPTGVSATFAPAEAGEDTEQLSLTLDATRDAVRGPALLTLTATGTGKEPLVATTTLALEVRGATINGRLSGPRPAAAIVRVRVGESLATPDAEGNFTVEDVVLPYNLTVASTVGSTNDVIQFFPGLTTTEPVVRTVIQSGPGDRSGSVDVTLSVPVPVGQRVQICASGVDAEVSQSCQNIAEGASTATLSVNWTGPTSQRIKLYAYATNAASALTELFSVGTSPVFTLSQGASPDVSVNLGPAPTAAMVTTAVETPAWAVSTQVRTLAPLGESDFMFLGNPTAGGQPALSIPGAPSLAIASGASGAAVAWRPATDDGASPLVFPSLVEFLGATPDVTLTSELVVSAPAPGEITAIAIQTDRGMVVVHTASDRVTIPDVSDFWGTAVSPQGRVVLLLRASQLASMDDAVTGTSLVEQFMRLIASSGTPTITSAGGMSFLLVPPAP